MEKPTELTEALEDYLEAIYRIILKKNGVRVKDISEELKVRNPSVTSALKSLEKRGLINYEPYGIISLTKAGLEVALKVTEKHRLFKHFFMNMLGIDQATADATACRMEHIIPRNVYLRMLQFIKYLYTTDSCGLDVVNGFNQYRSLQEPDRSTAPDLDAYFEGTGFDLMEQKHDFRNA